VDKHGGEREEGGHGEEIGKGDMQWLKTWPNASSVRDTIAWVDKHSDDHEQKLFWALWSFRFEDAKTIVRDLQEHVVTFPLEADSV